MEKSNQFTHLEKYSLILIRYNEIWLKSTKVKIRMLKILMDNIKTMLNNANIKFHKYQLSKDSSRIFFFFNSEDIPLAIEIMGRVFGIFSFSPALRTSNKLKNIIERTIEVCKEVLQEGDSFALRVKRSGKHEYSSQDVAVKVGQAVIDHFADLKLKVNLSSPDKKIFIEIRDEFSYIFTDIIKSKWGGLPIETNKKILTMDIGRLNDLLAGFLLMKRGATIYPVLFDLSKDGDLYEKWISNWKEVIKYTPFSQFTVRKINLAPILEKLRQGLEQKRYICAICRLLRFNFLSKLLQGTDFKSIRAITDGVTLNDSTLCTDTVDLESIALNYLFSKYPVFTPTIGLESNKIEELISKISRDLVNIDYCQFKPKNQEINIEELKNLYKSLNINDLILESLNNIEEIKIF